MLNARIALLTAAIAMCGSATASASTVALSDFDDDGIIFTTLKYDAAAGEANQLVITVSEDHKSATVTDPGATITAGQDCKLDTPNQATCKATGGDGAGIWDIRANLGDQNDTATITGEQGGTYFGNGGAGDDELLGGDGSTELNGGPGADKLTAGKGVARLIEGDPDSDPRPDILEGAGTYGSTASYEGRTAPVTIDLRTGTGGAAGENDVLHHITSAEGGAGDDTLFAGSETIRLAGNGGDDTFDSTEGNTEYDGFYEAIDLVGGKGVDNFTCSPDAGELITGPNRGEPLAPDCDYLNDGSHRRDWHLIPQPVSYTKTTVVHKLACVDGNDDAQTLPCTATAKLQDPDSGATVAKTVFSAERNAGARKVVFVLSKRGRRMLRDGDVVDVILTCTDTKHGTKYGPATWSFTLGDERR
jgi:hypothetical protein